MLGRSVSDRGRPAAPGDGAGSYALHDRVNRQPQFRGDLAVPVGRSPVIFRYRIRFRDMSFSVRFAFDGGLSVEGVFGPGVLRISAPEVFPDLMICGCPEASQIVGDLDGPIVRSH